MNNFIELLFKVLGLNPEAMWIQLLMTSTIFCLALSLFTKGFLELLRDFSDTCTHVHDNLKNISNKEVFTVVAGLVIIFFFLICFLGYIYIFLNN